MSQATKLVLLVSMLCPILTYAQSIRVNVPFQFGVGDLVMPSGVYTIQRVNVVGESDAQYTIRGMRSDDGSSKFFSSNRLQFGRQADATKLYFDCYKDMCFLAQFIVQGESEGRQVFRGKAEREVQAKTNSSKVVVSLAALK